MHDGFHMPSCCKPKALQTHFVFEKQVYIAMETAVEVLSRLVDGSPAFTSTNVLAGLRNLGESAPEVLLNLPAPVLVSLDRRSRKSSNTIVPALSAISSCSGAAAAMCLAQTAD